MQLPVMAFFERSLRVESRSALMCWGRIGLLVVIFLVMMPLEAMLSTGQVGAPGLDFFQSIVWVNFACITVAGMSYFASAIAEEKEEMMLGLLRMTNLSPVGMLLGKSTSRLIGAILLLVVQVPFTLLAITLGGVSLHQIIAAYVELLAYMIFIGNVALLFSVMFRRSVTAAFFSGLFLVLFQVMPYFIREFLSWLELIHQVNITQGIWEMMGGVAEWLRQISPLQQLGGVFTTGYNDPIFGAARWSLAGLGLVAFVLAWLVFDRFTREQKEDAPFRLMLWKPKAKSLRVPEYVQGGNAITWKDSIFLGGGRMSFWVKFLAVGGLIGFLLVFINYVVHEVITAKLMGLVLIWTSLLAGDLMLAFEVSRLFKSEVQWKTWSSLVVLPFSVSEIAYRKVAGCLIGLIPILAYFVIGVLLASDDVGKIFSQMSFEAFLGVLLFLGQNILFMHVVAALSLLIKRGALPLAFVVYYLGATLVTVPFAIFLGISMGRISSIFAEILGLGATAAVTVGLHVWIGKRLVRVAAQE